MRRSRTGRYTHFLAPAAYESAFRPASKPDKGAALDPGLQCSELRAHRPRRFSCERAQTVGALDF